ncbi:DNA-binding protein [Devosia sediminis]|uniref:DNA-binding protein n=1 Tax=Devosia sediminis TaxID=2798801 RepID=A0A934J2D3_9HYPH|nr:DNA-binding protein [Devosia sediminis]MBJ3786404.1 DNA-binding protein [Devosia sediminis]
MSNEIATLERVRDAVAALRQSGIQATAENVIKRIGGGSKSTVIGHLRVLRTKPVEPDAVPPAVVELARSALAEIYQAGVKAEGERLRSLSERLSLLLEEQDVELQDLAVENARLENELSGLRAAHETQTGECEDLRRRLLEADQQLRLSRSEADLERNERSETTIARLEALLSDATEALQGKKK